MMLKIPSLPNQALTLPTELEGLRPLATNMYWTWQPDVQALFDRVVPGWSEKKHGPIHALRHATDLDAKAKDAKLVAEVNRLAKKLADYLASADKAWFPREASHTDKLKEGPVSYFCAEYAFYEGFNQYAGGLGILAGDHCKEASDIGLPFIAVGLFYRRGFFHQMVDWEGRQEHLYRHFDPGDCCCLAVADKAGKPLVVQVPFEGREVACAVWLMQIGRVPVIALDSDLPQNKPADRAITSQLYCNSRSMRLHQEAILGVGGVKALRALGIDPQVYHLNEGHSALLLVERMQELVKSGSSLKSAISQIKPTSVISIHTPVPEGNERFDAKLAEKILKPLVAGTGISVKDLLKMGLGADKDAKVFDMTAFALQATHMANGVSLLHGRTADKTWRKIAKKKVIGVTNGVHAPTWLGSEMRGLYEGLGASFESDTSLGLKLSEGREWWEKVYNLSDEQLWQAHQKQKKALLQLIHDRLLAQHARHGEGPEQLEEIAGWLQEDGLLIGFARRFAPYKRPALALANPSRAGRLLNSAAGPIQIVFSGKSHPSDRGGQSVVQSVYGLTQQPKFRGKLLYLEDYDMELGRALTQGVDVWLNNPRRPLEASGTSGMKAAMNGIPNSSILDGWWDEACVHQGAKQNGFLIGDRQEPKTLERQDKRDALALYTCLEEQVIPTFFKRNSKGLPEEWLKICKHSIASSMWAFSTHRMLRDYWNDMYSK